MLIMWDNIFPPLSLPVLKTVKAFGYESMTPVQESCIPLFMKHKDVAAEAVTGSGKTLAFVIPVIEMLLVKEYELRKHDIAALIISPTRELATQIFNVILPFLEEIPKFTAKLLIGGTNPQYDIDSFQETGGHIIVATPGRLEDFLQRSFNGMNVSACSKSLEVLVLDEADRLLHMGFKKSLTTILGLLPKQRRTGIFSATQTQEVEDLIRAGMRNPVRVSVKQKSLIGSECCDQKTPILLKNFYMVCDADMKLNCLCEFLKIHKDDKIMLFFSTCACVDYFCNVLKRLLPRIQILSIHRKKDNRKFVVDKFKDIKSGVLVCTDVMGRGIDLPNISWVIQFDPPVSVSNFVHRCGRTARIGNMGNALVMLLENELPYVEFIKLNQKVPLELFTLKPSDNVLEKVKAYSLGDRAIYEKGLQAFVSFIQSYAKHECNLIFRIKDINLGKLAQGFGLLHLPKMPEIKKNLIEFVPTYCDYKAIPYQDRQREQLRQEKLSTISEKKNFSGKKKMPILKQNVKLVRKSKRMMKEYELDELMNDARLVKKFKSGKITKEEFDGAFKDS